MSDLISRQAATTLPVLPKMYREYQTFNLDDAYEKGWMDCQECIADLPSAQPERLTDDDFETIRIHLNAYKEKLCNQRRWKEAEEYQRIIDRFMAFVSAEPAWIPVSERLPEDDMQVLLTYYAVSKSGNKVKDMIWANYRKSTGRFIFFGRVIENPIAWMPLPKMYRQEEN